MSTTLFSASCSHQQFLKDYTFDAEKVFNGNQFDLYLKRFVFVSNQLNFKVPPTFIVRKKLLKRNKHSVQTETTHIGTISVSTPLLFSHESFTFDLINNDYITLDMWLKVIDWLKKFGLFELEFFCGIVEEDSLNPLLSEFKFDKLFFDSTRRKPPKIKEFKAKLVLSQENKIQPSVNLQLNRERSVTLNFEFAPVVLVQISDDSVLLLSKDLAQVNIIKEPKYEENSTNSFDWHTVSGPNGVDCVITDPGNNPAHAVGLFWDQARYDKFHDFEVAAATHDGQGLNHMKPDDVTYWTQKNQKFWGTSRCSRQMHVGI
jgi:hypothetical protein